MEMEKTLGGDNQYLAAYEDTHAVIYMVLPYVLTFRSPAVKCKWLFEAINICRAVYAAGVYIAGIMRKRDRVSAESCTQSY